KLVRVVQGAVYDVIVDMRRSSPTFGQWQGVELSSRSQMMLWAPPGVAHGFLSLQEDTHLLYTCREFSHPEAERAPPCTDPALGQWAGARAALRTQEAARAPPGGPPRLLSLPEDPHLLYKCTEFYHPEAERCLLWNDPALGIEWPLLDLPPTISAKDLQGVS